jgi:hypothetical protein
VILFSDCLVTTWAFTTLLWRFNGSVNHAGFADGSAAIPGTWPCVLHLLVRQHLLRLPVPLLPIATTPVSAPEALQTTHGYRFCGVGNLPSGTYNL